MNSIQSIRPSLAHRSPVRSFQTLTLFLSLFLTACGSGGVSSPPPPEPPPKPIVSQVRISPNASTLSVGDQQQFVATALDGKGEALSGLSMTWKIDDPAVAEVDSNGMVKGLQEGTTRLTASIGETISNPATIHIAPPPPVRPPIASIEITASSLALSIGNTAQFAAVAKDANGQQISGVTFTWSSSNPRVADIDAQSGTALAVSPGSTTITVTAEEGATQTAVLTVKANAAPVPRITADPKSGTAPLTVTFNASGSNDPDGVISIYSWDFGDQSPTATGITLSHVYNTANTYTARLTVTDNNGATASTTITITVDPSSPNPPPSGKGWTRQGVNGDLFGISFVSATEGWTVGLDQTIAHSTDGGRSWTLQNGNIAFKGSSPPSSDVLVDLYDVFFIDARTGWAVGWPEAIFKTTDGGATWVEQHLNRTAWGDRTGDGVWDRRDWCEVWNSVDGICSKKYGSYLRKVQFVDSQNGWTVGRFGFIFKTADGGAHWQEIPQNSTVRPLPAPCIYPSWDPKAGQPRTAVNSYNPHLFSVDVISPNEVWVSGGSEGDEPCDKGWLRVIWHTVDGGQHWQYFYDFEGGGTLEGPGRLFDIRFSRNANGSAGPVGFAVGGNATGRPNVQQTTDGGKTWHKVSGASNYSNGFYGLAFLSPSQVLATGWGGLILHSEDGGTTWSRQNAQTTSQLRRVFFLDANSGWIAGQGQVFFTTSGGK